MKDETIWQAFCETGDPLAYLLYRLAFSAGQTARGDGAKVF